MKAYRKKFILLNMALIGSVLLLVLIGIGIYMYHYYNSDLKDTMKKVVERYETSEQSHEKTSSEGKTNSEGKTKPEEKPDSSTDKSITIISYSNDEDSISIISKVSDYDEASLNTVVDTIKKHKSSYGILHEYDLIYYRHDGRSTTKIALTPTSNIIHPMIELIGVLFLIFVLSMILFYIISWHTSKLAIKPLKAAINMEKQFVTDISHDLKTPLTVIIANNSILRQNPDSSIAEQMNWIESTETASKNMLTMINEMMTLSAIDSADTPTENNPQNLSSIAEKALLQIECLAYEKNITLTSELQSDIFINGDADYLQRITTSLIENAIKYEPDNGMVSVSLIAHKKTSTFSVRNFSTVIDADDLPHIFERFYRGDKSRNTQSGHGLGLAIAKNMTEAMGGTIDVRSNPSDGTIFSVQFPM